MVVVQRKKMKKGTQKSIMWVLLTIIVLGGGAYYMGYLKLPAGGVDTGTELQPIPTTILKIGKFQFSDLDAKQLDIVVKDTYRKTNPELSVLGKFYAYSEGAWSAISDFDTSGTNDIQYSPGTRIEGYVGGDNATTKGFYGSVDTTENGTKGWCGRLVDYTVGDRGTQTLPEVYIVKQSLTAPTITVYSKEYNTLSDGTQNQTIIAGTTYNLRVVIQPASEEAFGCDYGVGYTSVACAEFNGTLIKTTDMQLMRWGSDSQYPLADVPSLLFPIASVNTSKCWKVTDKIEGGNEVELKLKITGNSDASFGNTAESIRLKFFDVGLYVDKTSGTPSSPDAFKFGIVDENNNNIGLPSTKEPSVTIGLHL